MQKLSLALAVASTLAGCASGPSPLQGRLESIPETQRGYVVGTYSVDCRVSKDACTQAFNSISADYRMTDAHEVRGRLAWTSGSMFQANTVHDYINTEEKHKGFHFCIALPPGSYEIHSISYYNFAGGGSGYSVAEKDFFSVPFSVSSGEVSDLGTIRITTTRGRNLFGIPLPAPGVMLLSPPSASSQSATTSRCPEAAKAMPVRSSPLQLAPGKPSPFVQSTNR